MKSIHNNPYRIASILFNVSERELQKARAKIKAYIKVGKENKTDYGFEILKNVARRLAVASLKSTAFAAKHGTRLILAQRGARAMKLFILTLFALATLGCSETDQGADMFKAYRGLYRVAPDHIIGISAFIDDGTPTMLFSDYQTGVVRPLIWRSEAEFVMGSDFDLESPAQPTITFLRDGDDVTGLTLQPVGATESTAVRVHVNEEEVVFRSADATLSGTLIIPEGNDPRPAIILLHGSGPLTRYSFGPYPHFFASLGFAVLIYDKRGTGSSTGTRVDAGTGRAVVTDQYYPEGLARDALAALDFLRSRPEIDPRQIGFWGSSAGGMLATQVAARSPHVAFAINSSGFMGSLWQTTLYQAAAIPRRNGLPETDVQEAVAFTEHWLEVARTGRGWDSFVKWREEMRQENESALFWSSGEFASVEEMRWYWDHVLSFSPLPALRNVNSPVLGVFGELDLYTDVTEAAENMQRALTEGGNEDVTVKIFPEADHSLSLASEDRMAPGLFDTLRSWLLARVQFGGAENQ